MIFRLARWLLRFSRAHRKAEFRNTILSLVRTEALHGLERILSEKL